MWELGTSEKAMISCKERFLDEPDHSCFLTEIDHGTEIIRCDGWQNVTSISFVDNPPFLLFDISSSFRESINSLHVIPRQISVYGQMYKLGGVTSFVASRGHYVGYIAEKDGYLFYDGLPSNNPILKKYNMTRIHGDISLLCYFPLDNIYSVSHTPSDSPSKSESNIISSKLEEDKKKGDSKVKDGLSNNSLSRNEIDITSSQPQNPESLLTSNDDALLAQALQDIEKEKRKEKKREKEKKNAYLKPKPKSYRFTNIKRKPVGNGKDTKDVLKFHKSYQKVKVSELLSYMHFDRDINQLPGKGKVYKEKLWSDIKKNGLENPLSLSVSQKTGRAVLFDGNHRLTIFRNKKVEWVPLKVSYFFIENDYDESFNLIPRLYEENCWPSKPTPENMGFTVEE